MNTEAQEDLTEVFRQEANAIVESLSASLMALERDTDATDARTESMRHFHTLKGMANMEGHPELARLCHEAENALVGDDSPHVDALLRRVDEIRRWLDEHGLGPRRDEAGEGAAYVMVQTDRLDRLLNIAGELTVTTTRLVYEDTSGASSTETLRTLNGLVRDLQEEVMKTRLLPARTLLAGLPRLARDTAKSRGVEVSLILDEGGISIDRSLVDKLGGALAHLVQNSIAHGIEPPQERVARGKPPRGEIRVQLHRDQETVAISVSDDGHGFDEDAIRAKAVEQGMLSLTQAAQASPSELAELLFAPGFTTSAEADRHSGRGIGLTAVRETVRGLGGTLRVTSAAGKGATATIRLPPTVALLHTLVARANGATIALPLRNVRRIAPTAEATDIAGRPMLLDRTHAIPLYTVRGERAILTEGRFAIILEAARGTFAIVVEELLGTHSTILKPLDPYILARHSTAMGATVLGSGTLAIVIDPNHYKGRT